MKKLETLERTEWNKIKVGEVFAYDGCWAILAKLDDENAIFLEDNYGNERMNMIPGRVCQREGINFIGASEGWPFGILCSGGIYKLPQSVQKLWRQD